MANVKIRIATEADADALRQYATKLFAERHPGLFQRPAPTVAEELEFIRARVGHEPSVLLLAELRGRVVGLLDFAASTQPQASHGGAIGMSVDLDCRGRGVGTALIHRLVDWALEHEIRRIELQVFANNARAIKFYERLGFEHEGRRRDAIVVDGVALDAVLMARILRDRGTTMTSIEHTKSFEMAVPIAELFPLFSPEGEKLWVPGWDYENVMGQTELSEDYVFLTRNHDHRTADAIWVIKRYDPEAYLVELYKIEPEDKIGVVKVKCTDLGNERTEVQVTYKYMALSASGEAFVSSFDESAYDDFIGEWQTLLSNYFETES